MIKKTERGNDLKLTIDIELQKYVDNILAKIPVITVPIFVFLNIPINCEATNSNNNIVPILARGSLHLLSTSVLFLNFLEANPYTIYYNITPQRGKCKMPLRAKAFFADKLLCPQEKTP